MSRHVPGIENEFLARSSLNLVRDIIHSKATLILGKISNKVLIIRGIAPLLDHNLLVVCRQFEDDIAELLLQLQLVERHHTIIVRSDSRGLETPDSEPEQQTQRLADYHDGWVFLITSRVWRSYEGKESRRSDQRYRAVQG